MFIGVLGFFTLLIFVATVRAELRGDPSVVQALALAVMVGLVAFTWRMRRQLVAPAARTGRTSSGGPEAGA
jgi:hypothetical protein